MRIWDYWNESRHAPLEGRLDETAQAAKLFDSQDILLEEKVSWRFGICWMTPKQQSFRVPLSDPCIPSSHIGPQHWASQQHQCHGDLVYCAYIRWMGSSRVTRRRGRCCWRAQRLPCTPRRPAATGPQVCAPLPLSTRMASTWCALCNAILPAVIHALHQLCMCCHHDFEACTQPCSNVGLSSVPQCVVRLVSTGSGPAAGPGWPHQPGQHLLHEQQCAVPGAQV